MAIVPRILRERWRSGKHVGAARPQQTVLIRRGQFTRRHDLWSGDDYSVVMPGRDPNRPWQAFWTPIDDYRTLPNVLEVNLEQDFDNNGITTATVEIDNVWFAEQTGPGGIFHAIVRGALAPFRGYQPGTRPQPGLAMNEWFRFLASACQIEVWQGYGDSTVRTFTGLLEDLDLTSAPDNITITARDFGQALTDQHLLGYAKDTALSRKPTVFADRRQVDKTFHEGSAGPDDASSSAPGHPPRFVADEKDEKTSWLSTDRSGPDLTEFVQVRIPRGRYESFYLHPAYAGMEMWVSLFTRKKGVKHVKVDGEIVDEGWLDLAAGDTVPGDDNGGHHYIKHYARVDSAGHFHPFGHVIEVGDDSVLRVSFRRLREVKLDGHTRYRAGVRRLIAIRRKTRKEAIQQRWILVDDLADVVKTILIWAGFKEWDIETTGLRLPQPMTFHNGDTLMDVIKKCSEMVNYTFFMGDPSGGEDEASIGVPVWRFSNPFAAGQAEQVRDTDVLTGIQAKWTRTVLPEIVYIRGKAVTVHGSRTTGGGVPFGEQNDLRLQASYRPPWTKRNATGRVIKHFVQTYNNLTTQQDCEVAARLVALNACLRALTATIEVPGFPGINLGDNIGVLDEGTGTNTRLYVASRSSSFHAGETTAWKMTLGGALIDTPDTYEVAMDLLGQLGNPAEEYQDAVPVANGGRPQSHGGDHSPARTRTRKHR